MRILAVITVMVLVVGYVTFGLAQQPTPVTAAKAEHHAKTARWEKATTLWGEVVSVDTTLNAVTLKGKSGKTDTVKVDPKVMVKKAGKTIPLNALATGDRISLSYKMVNGEKVATFITERTAPENKEPGTKKPVATPVPK
jgi:Cu/Ag efflux protein CusF